MIAFFRSMSGRVFLILLIGILTSASLTWWLAVGERQRALSQLREARVLEQAEQVILTLNAMPRAARAAFIATSRRLSMQVELGVDFLPSDTDKSSAFANALGQSLGSEYSVVSLPITQAQCPVLHRHKERAAALAPRGSCEALGVTLRDGSRLRLLTLTSPNPMPPLRSDFYLYLALFLSSIAVLAYAVARMTMRPLKQLAQAAHDLGRDIDHPPLAQTGTTEIRQATAAFNTMQARIRQHIQQRTQMLAAITHDLQTPLTRLRLRLEKVADESLREKLVGDLAATQAMVREGLELARSMDAAEPLQALNLDSLFDSVCSDATDAGQEVTLTGRTGLSMMARPGALRRCLNNLIDNAIKYGRFAAVTVQRVAVDGRPCARIEIRDGGPGIAADQMQQVFEPFYRIEGSRSRDTGGTGLGLTIARNIAEQHGGSIALANHAEGGLVVTLILPTR